MLGNIVGILFVGRVRFTVPGIVTPASAVRTDRSSIWPPRAAELRAVFLVLREFIDPRPRRISLRITRFHVIGGGRALKQDKYILFSTPVRRTASAAIDATPVRRGRTLVVTRSPAGVAAVVSGRPSSEPSADLVNQVDLPFGRREHAAAVFDQEGAALVLAQAVLQPQRPPLSMSARICSSSWSPSSKLFGGVTFFLAMGGRRL